MSAPAQEPDTDTRPRRRMLHPVMMMLGVIIAALALTYMVDSGHYQRKGKLVVPGTYQVLAKTHNAGALLATSVPAPTESRAAPASFISALNAVPRGMVKNSELIFMVMFIGGMFGVMRRTGVVDAGIDRLLEVTDGNVYVLAPLLMLLIGLGSTFLGFISEYLVIIPVLMVLAKRLGLSNLFAVALVAIAAKIGYIASVTNPLALAVAQPLVGVPLFSGMGMRLAVFVVFLPLGILYLMHYVRRSGYVQAPSRTTAGKLSPRHTAILIALALAGVALVLGTRDYHWHSIQLASFYVFLSVVIALLGGLDSRSASDAFVDGMKGMILAGLLIGLAASVELILQDSAVLDTLIHAVTSLAKEQSPAWVAQGLMGVQMFLDVFIPSVSGKAAVTMPIIGPIAQLSGVSGQTTILAFLLGGGLTNMVTPTSGMLLAYLATARVGYGEWIRFILPLFIVLFLLSGATLAIAVSIGY